MAKESSNSNKSDNKPLPTGMAFKYETAYTQLYDAAPAFIRASILEDPLGRYNDLMAHQAARLAEKGEISKRHREQGPMTFDPNYMLAPSGVAEQ